MGARRRRARQGVVATLAILLAALGVLLLASGYVGYGGIILILAAAAAVNLF